VRQLEQILGTRLFGRSDFSLTTEGSAYLSHVREGLGALQRFPGEVTAPGRRRLKLAVTPTFARVILIPRLRQFTETYPEIDIALQVSIPLLDVVAEDADLMVRFGPGHYADVEHIELARDVVTPLASPAFIREHGPFEQPQDLEGMPLLRSPLEPWRTWFGATGLDWPEPHEGSQFNDIGLMCDAASAGMGIALVPRCLVHDEIAAGLVNEPLPQHGYQSALGYWLCYPADRANHGTLGIFRNWLVDHAAQTPGRIAVAPVAPGESAAAGEAPPPTPQAWATAASAAP